MDCGVFDCISFILAGNKDNDEFKFRPDRTMDSTLASLERLKNLLLENYFDDLLALM